MIEEDDLPEGSVINAEITVVSYFDENGILRYKTGIQGNPNIAQFLGLLVLAGISVFREYAEDDEEEEEENDE